MAWQQAKLGWPRSLAFSFTTITMDIFGRLPVGGSEVIDIHGELGGLLQWAMMAFSIYALTLGMGQLFRRADLVRLLGSLSAWQRLSNTAARLNLVAAVLGGLPIEDDWLFERFCCSPASFADKRQTGPSAARPAAIA